MTPQHGDAMEGPGLVEGLINDVLIRITLNLGASSMNILSISSKVIGTKSERNHDNSDGSC